MSDHNKLTKFGGDKLIKLCDFQIYLNCSRERGIVDNIHNSEYLIKNGKANFELATRFVEDGPDAKTRIRKRGTPMSSPLADVFSEVVLFVMDYAVNQYTQGSRLYRLHDDLWFWGPEHKCVQAWTAVKEFSDLMGLKLNAEKSGCFRISYKDTTPLNPTLP